MLTPSTGFDGVMLTRSAMAPVVSFQAQLRVSLELRLHYPVCQKLFFGFGVWKKVRPRAARDGSAGEVFLEVIGGACTARGTGDLSAQKVRPFITARRSVDDRRDEQTADPSKLRYWARKSMETRAAGWTGFTSTSLVTSRGTEGRAGTGLVPFRLLDK